MAITLQASTTVTTTRYDRDDGGPNDDHDEDSELEETYIAFRHDLGLIQGDTHGVFDRSQDDEESPHEKEQATIREDREGGAVQEGVGRQAPNPLSPRRMRCAHCRSSFEDNSYVQECRECQASVHATCLRPHVAQTHAERRLDSGDEDPELRRCEEYGDERVMRYEMSAVKEDDNDGRAGECRHMGQTRSDPIAADTISVDPMASPIPPTLSRTTSRANMRRTP